MNNISYQNAIWTIIFDEENRMPLWMVDDIIINTTTFKVEALIVKNSFFKRSKMINTSSIISWWKDIYASSYSIKDIESSAVVKTILTKQVWIIWNNVEDETWKNMGQVIDFLFTRTTFQWISIIIKQSFFWLFYYWKSLDIGKKDVVDVTKDKIVVKNLKFVKA